MSDVNRLGLTLAEFEASEMSLSWYARTVFTEPRPLMAIPVFPSRLVRHSWPYGIERNHETLATFLRYSHEQGRSPRRLEPEELFAPESLDTAKT